MAKDINIGGRLHSIATGNVIAGADEILDDNLGKKQTQINTETYSLVESVNNALAQLSPDQQEALGVATKANANEAKLGYYVCDTDANTAAKTVVATNYVLGTGGSIKVKMTNDNTVNNATLNINSTGAKPLFYEGVRASSTNSWTANDVLEIYYDGTNYQAKNVSPTFKTGEKVNSVGIDDEPKAGSDNLIKSGGVYKALNKTSEISKEYTDVGNEVVIEDDNGNEVLKITEDYVDAKNLKSNGQDVLTQHQDISGKADKSYVDEELAEKQDKVDGLSSETIINTAESIELTSDDSSETYAKIYRDGLCVKKGINLFYDTPSDDKDISCKLSLELEDEIVFTDDNNVPSASITKDGVKVRSLMDINGNKIPLGSAYISPNGNDANIGIDPTHPMKTVNEALAKGFNSIILLEGVYKQTIDTTQINSHKIEIKGARGKKVVFKKADSLISDSGEEVLVNGYTKVYKLENVADINYGSVTNRAEWLFFDDKVDETTPISSDTAHPLERGKFYRCDCTKSIKTTASTLVDALTEIEALGENIYKWFYDSENHILYFNRPDSTSVYALYKSVGDYFTTKENQSLVLSNIEFRYGVVNLSILNIVKVYNCCAQCVYGPGAFVYGHSLSVEFIKCEAALCFSGTNGDGFNAHAGDSSGDYKTKRNQSMHIDCWSHDNNDDGYSDHEYGETTIIGGLYEYNKKGGIVPSYGSHCTCYNTYSRHNYSGFRYVGAVNDRGNNGQLACYNCISEKNDGGGIKVGYYVDSGNRVQLFNCLAINEVTGFKCVSGCYMDLYDCKTLACTTQKVAEGTLNVYNSIIVS